MLAALAGVGAMTALTLVALGISGGPRDQGIDVAAAAYRAVAPGPGILYTVTETTQTNPSGQPRGLPVRLESWSTVIPAGEHSIQITGTHVFEQATAGHQQSTWTSGQPNVIQTTTLSRVIGSPQDPAATLRSMYRAGHVTVVGRGELNGRPVWHLKIAAPAIQRVGPQAPGVTAVIDAKTFDPIELTGYAVQSTGNGPFRVISTNVTRYLVVQHLPATPGNRALLRITDHPHAKIVH